MCIVHIIGVTPVMVLSVPVHYYALLCCVYLLLFYSKRSLGHLCLGMPSTHLSLLRSILSNVRHCCTKFSVDCYVAVTVY